MISLKKIFATASWGPLKKKKIRGPWARAQCAHWLRRPCRKLQPISFVALMHVTN